MLIPIALAESGSSIEANIMSFAPMIIIFVLFYFLMIRPQQKRAKEHRVMLQALQNGDELITTGGIVGRVVKTSDNYLTLEIADNVEIVVQRAAVGARLEKGTMKTL
jgi:preprotein translocase subunit YajC